MKRELILAALTTALLSTGCQKSGIEKARAESEPLVEAACAWMFGCCSSDELVYQLGDFTVSADNCSERLLDAIEVGVPLELEQQLSDDPAAALLVLALSINEGRVKVNSEAIEFCASQTSSMACNMPTVLDPDERCTPGGQAAEDPCDPDLLFNGVQKVGEPCYGPWECETGLRCIDFGLAGVCASRIGLGGTCFSDLECATDLICDWQSGTCANGAQLGQSCAFADPNNPQPGTESIRCGEDLSCDPLSLTCVGGYCSPGATCFDTFNDSDCPVEYFCIGNSFTQSTCQQPGDIGAPCNKDLDCQSATCDQFNEICATLLTDGDGCVNHDQCQSGFCDAGTCTASVGPGQPCNSFQDEECAGGYCDTNMAPPVCIGYAGEGDACMAGNECDPTLSLSCVDMTCLLPPFANGTSCFNDNQCESSVCFMGTCSAGTDVGGACTTDFSTEPCVLGAFCEAPNGTVDGTCAPLRRSGEPCENSMQCWGQCEVRFGSLMCDSTPAFELGELWCDGLN